MTLFPKTSMRRRERNGLCLGLGIEVRDNWRGRARTPGLGYKKSQLTQGARQVGSQKPESHVRQATPSE